MELRYQRQIIAESGAFQNDWFCWKYAPNLQGYPDALGYFLDRARDENLCPNRSFDLGVFYAFNPGAKASRLNPLVYKILNDCPIQGVDDVRQRIAALRMRAQGGDYHSAAAQLDGIADHPDIPENLRAEAAFAKAICQAQFQDIAAAISTLQAIEPSVADTLKRRILSSLASLHLHMGSTDLARACFERLKPLDEPQYLLGTAITLSDPTAKIASLNQLFESQGLSPIKLKNPAAKMSFDTLEAPCLKLQSPQPTVSVLVPAFNAQDTISCALSSLRAQSHSALEILVVDDASRDQTAAIVQRHCDADPRVRLIRQDQNQGAYAARNRALPEATGEYVTVHDADDWSHPEKIAKQVAPFEREEAPRATLSGWSRVREDFTAFGNWQVSGDLVNTNLSSLMVHTHDARGFGGWAPLRVGADAVFLARIEHAYGEDAVEHVCPGIPLSFARALDTSLTRTAQTHITTKYSGLRRNITEIGWFWLERSEHEIETHLSRQLCDLEQEPDVDCIYHIDLTLEEDVDALSEALMQKPGQRSFGVFPISTEKTLFQRRLKDRRFCKRAGWMLANPRVRVVHRPMCTGRIQHFRVEDGQVCAITDEAARALVASNGFVAQMA